ncbi:nose resistant to fluoxetine protein 6-like [Ptychodera flava]|uniref:nose resistant to fluoxetine protein 6-like n=1 Tax=Ptychodera flava TaxID=63121 RepID=UPI00396A39F5
MSSTKWSTLSFFRALSLVAILFTADILVGAKSPFSTKNKKRNLDAFLQLTSDKTLYRPDSSNAWQSGPCSSHCDKTLEETGGIGPQCYCDMCQYNQDLDNNERYAMEMFDSQGRFPSGLLKLNFKWIGSYVQCRSVSETGKESYIIKGQYCLTGLFPKAENDTDDDASLSLIDIGMCTPDSCSEEDVEMLLKEDLLPLPGLVSLLDLDQFHLTNVFCSYDGKLSTGAIVMLCITGVLLILVISGTCYEYYKMPKNVTQSETDSEVSAIHVNFELKRRIETDLHTSSNIADKAEDDNGTSLWEELLTSFSVISNGARILDTSDVDPSLTSLHGLRVLAIIYMILGQSLLLSAEFFSNPLDLTYILEFTIAQIAVYFTYCEDTFLVISGFLVTYFLFLKLESDGKVNWIQYYIHCIWRLTPTYYIALFAYMYLAEIFMEGSLTFYHHQNMEVCYENWWANALYINNLYPFPGNLFEQCGYWFWYMACVMQFYIITPIIIAILAKWPVIGLSVIGVLIAVCVGCTVSLSAYYDIPVSVAQVFQGYMDFDNLDEIFEQHIHSKPYTRMTPYLVGMVVAYVIVKHGKEFKIRKWLSFIIWCVAMVVTLACIFGLYSTFQGNELSRGVTLLHHALAKLGFSLAVGWLVFACVTDHGGFIHRFLSWKFWIPLSRISFGAYLMHAFVMEIFVFNRDNLIFLSYANVVWIWIASMMAAYFAAFFFVLVTEKPLLRLEQVSWKKWNESRSKTET